MLREILPAVTDLLKSHVEVVEEGGHLGLFQVRRESSCRSDLHLCQYQMASCSSADQTLQFDLHSVASSRVEGPESLNGVLAREIGFVRIQGDLHKVLSDGLPSRIGSPLEVPDDFKRRTRMFWNLDEVFDVLNAGELDRFLSKDGLDAGLETYTQSSTNASYSSSSCSRSRRIFHSRPKGPADGLDWPLCFRDLTWLRGLDLNQRPLGYEPNELPGCSTPR